MSTLQNKNIVIIGGSQGIGLASAKKFVEEGAKITIASRSADKLNKAASFLQNKVETYVLDGSIEEDVKTFFEQFDKIDHLIISSSGGYGGEIQQLDLLAAKGLFDSKLWVQMNAVKHASPKMSAGSSIVLFSGIVSRKVMPGQMPYTGVAGAVESLGRMLALELAPIRVNVITPGIIKTPAWDAFMPEEQQNGFFDGVAASLPVKRVGEAEDVVKGVHFLLDCEFVTGTVLDIDGGHKVI